MDEANFQHYGKSAAARDDIAFLVNHDAAALLPESLTSHREIVFCQSSCLDPQFENTLARRMCDIIVALKQQDADRDYKIRSPLARRYSA